MRSRNEDEAFELGADNAVSTQMTYGYDVIRHDPRLLEIKLNFKHPEMISNTNLGSDRVEIKFLYPQFFKSI